MAIIRELETFPILTHLPWHVLLVVVNLIASELVLQCPLEECDHGKGGKLTLRDICLPDRISDVFLEDTEDLAASRSKDSKSLGWGSTTRFKISLGWHNGKSSGLAGVSGLLQESWILKNEREKSTILIISLRYYLARKSSY